MTFIVTKIHTNIQLTYYGNGKTYEGEHNKNDGDIGLFDLEQIVIIEEAFDKDIIMNKKWNVKRIIYKFVAENIG